MRFTTKSFKAAAPLGVAVLICGLNFTSAFISTPAMAQNQDIRAVMGRLEQLENRVNNTQSSNNAAGYNDSNNTDVGGGSSAAMYETRIAELEAQLRQLNGKIEEQDYAINQVKSQFELFKGDLEMRLNDTAANGANAAATPQPVAPVADPAVDTATDASTVNNMSVNNPAALYDEAFQALRGQDYTKAKAGFNEFIKRYPADNLAGNAQYWLGETHYVQGEYKSAARVFAEGYKKYPKNNKAPDNLLKLALTLDQLGQKKEACVTLGQLAKQFPNAASVIKQRNSEEQKRLECGA